jgi:hypothetical protein
MNRDELVASSHFCVRVIAARLHLAQYSGADQGGQMRRSNSSIAENVR